MKRLLACCLAVLLLVSFTACTDDSGAGNTVTTVETPTETTTLAPTETTLTDETESTTISSEEPSEAPTVEPSEVPTEAPTDAPTAAPTEAPTAAPTDAPTVAPTEAPTAAPTDAPTVAPTEAPTAAPTDAPTAAPTDAPTAAPTEAPTAAPTEAPTEAPTTTTTTTTPTTQSALSGADDRAWQANPGSLYQPKKSNFDAQANAIIAAMNKLPDTIKAAPGCTTYYVSEKNGNDNNDGTSKATPFQTVNPLRYKTFKAGDVVLFERGGLYRVNYQFNLTSGVSYGAYGTGDRPLIYGSTRNYANDVWTEVSPNVWTIDAGFPGDVGCVVFNHGEKWAQWVEYRSDLDKEMEFYSDLNNKNKLYLYTTTNPNGAYRSIEIGHDGQLFNFNNKGNIVIENLTFKYTGGHATRGSNTVNVTIRGCEYGFIGGSILHYTAGKATRYGNGAEFMVNSENTLIENCWFYQIYDSATTTQSSDANTTAKNFTFRNSLVEYAGMAAYEFWGCEQINILIENNVMRWAGYGHGGNKGGNGLIRAHIQSNYTPSHNEPVLNCTNYVVRNNIFDQGAYQLLNFCFKKGSSVTVDGNTYAQVKNIKRQPLGYFQDNVQLYFDDTVADTIKNTMGDKNATVVYY